MSARTFETRSRNDNSGGSNKYQLDVTACDVVDVVRCAGGWLIDRAMAGWDVTVVISEDHDERPLQILGVGTTARGHDGDASAPARARAIAASADALVASPELRADILRAIKSGIGDVLVWGNAWPDGVEPGLELVTHQLSCAARAFKAHALLAVGVVEPVGATETFRGRTTARGGYSDLTPSIATSLAQR